MKENIENNMLEAAEDEIKEPTFTVVWKVNLLSCSGKMVFIIQWSAKPESMWHHSFSDSFLHKLRSTQLLTACMTTSMKANQMEE